MPIKASAIQPAGDLLKGRAQLKSRLAQVPAAATLADMFALLNGTGLEAGVMDQARASVTAFLENGIAALETQLTGLGIEIDV